MNSPNERLLVVDDESTARILMSAALKKAGFEVITAKDGEEALRLTDAQPMNLVLLDVDMPGLSGYEVCRQLRDRFGAHLPILMVTGMDDVDSVEQAFEAGATDFIAKPVNWGLIGHRVRYLLRSHDALVALKAAQARHEAILSALPDLLFEVDQDGRFLDFHSPRRDLLFAAPERFLGRTIQEILPVDAAQAGMRAIREAAVNGLSSGHQYCLALAQGDSWFELSVSRKRNEDSGPDRFIMLSRDVSERKRSEAEIARLAYTDSLTGLPNRAAFLSRFSRLIERSAEERSLLGLLYLDLDGFKQVNDTLGHQVGDAILKAAAERLRSTVRATDEVLFPGNWKDDAGDATGLARLGGDEFTALIPRLSEPEDLVGVGRRIIDAMRRPFVVAGHRLTLTASVGIAVYPEDGAEVESLLMHADTAMYHAKNSGRDNLQRYSPTLTMKAVGKFEMERDLRRALDEGQFELVYQPLVETATGRAHCVEALLRWAHPSRGLLAPETFLASAQELGIMPAIGHWVLDTACREAVRWQQANRPIGLAVNLSGAEIAEHSLSSSIESVLRDAGLKPELLEIEVSESALAKGSSAIEETLRRLRGLGVRIALDDFGSGYSSLLRLSRLPISRLKVDRTFVERLLDKGHTGAIVRAVLGLTSSFGVRVTAEGVETVEQAIALKAMDCHSLQGFYFGRPVRACEVADLLDVGWVLPVPSDQDAHA